MSSNTYTENDYKSGDGMLTTIWGPLMWTFLHTMSFNYPVNPTKKDKKKYRDFIFSLVHVLPCRYCRINLKNNLKKKPLLVKHMKDRESFSRYIYELHEVVNDMLCKPGPRLTYEQVRERFEHFRSRCTVNQNQKQITKKNKTNKKQKEKGCTTSLYGEKSKCSIQIVPYTAKKNSFHINSKCIRRRLGNKTKKNKTKKKNKK